MKPKLKRSISFPEDGQTPAAWLTLTVTLMICYAAIVAFGCPASLSHPEAKTSAWTAARATTVRKDFVSSSADTILLMSVLPMRRRKIGVIGRAATLALLASGAGADAAEVAICSLVTKPANFDRQAVTFQGTATAVKKTTSRRGNDYTLFKLQGPRDCGTVDVFMWGHPKLGNGDHVRVEGVFESVHHQDRSVFYNQVEATKVVPVPKE